MAFLPPAIPAVIGFLGSSGGMAALGLASAGLTGLSAIQQGRYQAAVGRNNAAIAEANAAKLSEASQKEAMRSDQDYRALLGEQLAAQGASGFDILGRSQRSARMLTTRTGRRAATDIRQEGETAARNSLQDAANFRAEAKQAVRQGYITAAGAALGAASDVFKNGSLIGRTRRPRNWTR